MSPPQRGRSPPRGGGRDRGRPEWDRERGRGHDDRRDDRMDRGGKGGPNGPPPFNINMDKILKEEATKFFEAHKDEEWFREKYESDTVQVQREALVARAQEASQSFIKRFESGEIKPCFDFPYEEEDKARERERQKRDEKVSNYSYASVKEEQASEVKVEAKSKEKGIVKEEGEEGAVEENAPKMKEEGGKSEGAKMDTEEGEEKQDEDGEVEEVAKGCPSPKEDKEKAGPAPVTLFVKAIPPKATREQLEKIFTPEEGSMDLKLSDPVPYKDFLRLGWATYETASSCEAMFTKVNGTKLEACDDFKLEVVIHQTKQSTGKPKLTARSFAEKVRIKLDVAQARKICKHLDVEKGIVPSVGLLGEAKEGETKEGGKDEEDAEDKKKRKDAEDERVEEDSKSPKANKAKRDKEHESEAHESEILDRVVAYLREVHLFEYYAGEEFLDKAELERKHPGGYCRNRAPDRQRDSYRETKQESQLDHKIRVRLERKWVLDQRLGEEFVGKAMDKWFEDNITKVALNKFGSKFSNKLFREPQFVRKHIVNKHGDKYKEQLMQVTRDLFFHNYFADPQRIRPPPPPGTFPGPAFPAGRRESPINGKGGYPQGKGGYGGGYPDRSPRMRARSPPPRRGRSPPRRRESYGTPGGIPGRDPRGLHVYQDLDGATDDLQPLDFEAMELADVPDDAAV